MLKRNSENGEYPSLTVQQLKRYGYSAILVFALLSMASVLLFGSPTFAVAPATATFDYFVYPVLIGLGIGVVWALLGGRIAIEKYEKPFVAFAMIFIAVKYALTFLSAPTLLPLTHMESWYWMLSGTWVGAFLAFPFYKALLMNGALYITIVTVNVIAIWLKAGELLTDAMADLAASNFRYIGTLIAIVLLGYVKQQWVMVEKEAMFLRNIAHTDPLTGLPNRRRLAKRLEDAMAASHEPVTVILFDLDGFKEVNDQFGHNVGDDVLREISEMAQGVVRASDTFGRWGGEEFLVVCPRTALDDGVQLAERLRHMLASRRLHHGHAITGSFGVAAWHPGEKAVDLIERADEALYAAKEQGKDQVWSSVVKAAPAADRRVHLSRARRTSTGG